MKKLSDERIRELTEEFKERRLTDLGVECGAKLMQHPRGAGHCAISRYIAYAKRAHSIYRDNCPNRTFGDIDDTEEKLFWLEIIAYLRDALRETI
ncbi:MAG: hypothetical protein WC533_00220 [Candidatus Pacearchaeota archaeon]